MNPGWTKVMKSVGKGSTLLWVMRWHVYQWVYTDHVCNRIHQKYTFDSVNKFNMRLHASAGTLFMLWQWDFGIFPSSSTVHSWPALLLLQTQLSVSTVLRSVFMVCWHLGSASSHWGWAFTSRWVHKSTQRYVLRPYVGIVRCFRDKCKNNAWLRGTILKERRERGIIAAPCWLLCTGRRTSVCLTGLRTPLEQSSVCSHVRPELQDKQSYFKINK